MNIEEIQAELATIESDMQDMGYVRIEVSLLVEPGRFCSQARASTRDVANVYCDRGAAFFFSEGWSPREAIGALKTKIAAAPSPIDQRRDNLAKKLAEVIEEGRELGQSVDFLNPLEVSMKALSANAIAAE